MNFDIKHHIILANIILILLYTKGDLKDMKYCFGKTAMIIEAISVMIGSYYSLQDVFEIHHEVISLIINQCTITH